MCLITAQKYVFYYNYPKKTKEKEPAGYKSLYIKEKLIKEIEKIAKDNNTSFNNVIISMIEQCLEKK